MPVRVGFGRPYIDPLDLDGNFPILHMTEAERDRYNVYDEIDSREDWEDGTRGRPGRYQ